MSQAKKPKTGASGIKVAVVTTTIYVPKCLDDYFANAVTYGHADTLFVVTGDTKTPVEAKSFCAEASARHGVTCVFMDVEDQKAYMSKVLAPPPARDSLSRMCSTLNLMRIYPGAVSRGAT